MRLSFLLYSALIHWKIQINHMKKTLYVLIFMYHLTYKMVDEKSG